MQNLLKLHLILFSILVFIFGCNSSDLSEKEEKLSEENIDYSAAEGEYINVRSSIKPKFFQSSVGKNLNELKAVK